MELAVGIITLLVALAALYVSYKTYDYTKQSDKKRKRNELASKRAKLRFFQENMKTPFAQFKYDSTSTNFIQTKMDMLQIEIQQLEKEV